ncbi:hypothetical protein FK535_27435 [Mycolicibacterium sp. 018/SC-01/001]|uniref:hypothetical protein n=1 Tax=Mycolicibacterium sp. 018/SC-01/001 TaxID=2592069 RepID=UPI00117DAB2B|nr:hypothetical protein [Mycolicibacterium sp. 018/SC-01/001]TRW76748.1 hypothetical protein FK535_27435 [Mycolicibacterium sp. 018/SC-01/001]
MGTWRVLAAVWIGFLAGAPAVSSAQPAPPLHLVSYRVWAEQAAAVSIYYRAVDPPNFAAYSQDPYAFSPQVAVDVGPDRPWELQVGLANPRLWAMVTAGIAPALEPADVHCRLTVDGAVVAEDRRPRGALCSLRSW